MKANIYLDIGASHLRMTLKPRPPGWGRRIVRAVGSKLAQSRNPIEEAQIKLLPAEEIGASTITEVANWTPGATRAETISSLLEAAAQALQVLRARHQVSLDGSRLAVRTGVTSSYVGVVPVDFSSSSARSNAQLRIIAKAVSQEAMGIEAAGHELRWSIQVNQSHLCVITLESALVTSLQVMAQAQQIRLASCQPAIVEILESELKECRRQRDARTLMWTESDPSGKRYPIVTFVRLVNGSAVNAWRTVTSAPSDGEDIWLQPVLDRFLIASGASRDEQVIPCTWPFHGSNSVPTAPVEVAA
ncbi:MULTISPECIES: hypothetical protein [unclassified Polaromonas]|uniref:hypothetical protein n=1 Tax=unclassified Polaromonas TaxID=2638319 RepID=UPI000F09577A|nr:MULTISPECIES: hypothetical protein [unclassified Polaromonas]AYQ29522.1 hypothetical protein DT070_16775 [Polaromonas sp. SP1]QGJ19363.1 hypothetical protein F7R28_13820 [Polaromonas sp. Pch-P]